MVGWYLGRVAEVLCLAESHRDLGHPPWWENGHLPGAGVLGW